MKRFFDLQRFVNIFNDQNNTIISGTSKADEIYNEGYSVQIYAGKGNDFVDCGETASSCTIDGGAGNDSIYSEGSSMSINGGAGNDKISLKADDYTGSNTFNGGTGNDTIYGTNTQLDLYDGDYYYYANGDGYDLIYNYGFGDTICITSGYYSTSVSGENVIIYAYKDIHSKKANGAITLVGAAGYPVNIEGSFNIYPAPGLITNTNYSTVVSGTDGNDTIFNAGADDVGIYAGAGNDYVYNLGGHYVTLGGGAGNDTIFNRTPLRYPAEIDGGDGDDVICSNNSSRIDGGAGNDSIRSYGNSATINAGSGNDTVNFGGSWLSINAGAGNDMISLSNDRYGYCDANTIIGGKGNDTITGKINGGGTTYVYNLGDGYDKIYTYDMGDVVSIPGCYYTQSTVGSDVVLNIFSNPNSSSANGAITLVGAAGKDINIDNESFFHITNSDSYTVVSGTSDNDIISSTSHLSDVTINAGAGNDSVYSEYGKNTIIDAGAGSDTIDSKGGTYESINGGKGNDLIDLALESAYGNTIVGGKGNDTVYDSGYSDTLGNIYQYANGDGYDKILNYDSNDTLTFTSGYYTKSTVDANVIFYSYSNINSKKANGAVTLVDAVGKTLNIVGKEKNSDDSSDIKISDKKITLTKNYSKESFSLTGKYKSAVTVDASAVQLGINLIGNAYSNKIVGSTQNDTLDGGKGNDTLIGGKGSDILIGGKGDDTLTGGAGADVFVYRKGDGDDLITDYAAGDKISIKGDTVSDVSKSGKNVVFTLGSEKKITVKGGADKTITYSVNGKTNTYLADVSKYVNFNKKGTSAKLKSAYPFSSFTPTNYSDYKTSLITINGSAVSHDLNIVGNGNKNFILGGSQDDTLDGGKGADTIKGGAGNDSIFGGKGNDELHGGIGKDTLWGSAGDDELYGDAGADVFYYNVGEGNDTIFGYEANVDKIILGSGSVKNVYADKNNNVIFKIGDGQLVVNNGADRTIKIVNSSDKIVDNGLWEP